MRFVLSGLNGVIQKTARGKGVNMSLAFFDSHMPRHLFSDEHEWISDSNGPYSSTSGTKASHLGKEVVLSCTLV